MELILKYFPDLPQLQLDQLAALNALYTEWNEKINLISRKDIQHLYEHHVLHSLAIAKYDSFAPGLRLLDVGTGGGFPGIPLAIIFPDVHFTLVDSIAKKIHVVNEVKASLGLKNVTALHSRMEDLKTEYDVVTSRAVSTLTQLVAWTKHLLPQKRWIVLKGGSPQDFRKELPPPYMVKSKAISDFFEEEYFKEKYLVEVRG